MLFRLCLLFLISTPAFAALSLLSINARGEPGNGFSRAPAVSADGRLVAFMSEASNLVEGDNNGKADIFLCDRKAGTIRRISNGLEGQEADGNSSAPAISADGRFIAFVSDADNLVPDDTNKAADVFLCDSQTGAIEMVSVNAKGLPGNGASGSPAMGGDGRFIAFRSLASNLIPSDTNGFADIFLRDRKTGVTMRVSVSGKGEEADGPSDGAPAISADGRYVAFTSRAKNLSPDDGNGMTQDVSLRDVEKGTTACVSRPAGKKSCSGESGNPVISADGRYLAFTSFCDRLVPSDAIRTEDIYRYDRQAGTISVVSAGNDAGTVVSINGDGQYLAFLSHATDLVEGDANGNPDVFLYDAKAKTTTRVNVSPQGAEADDDSSAPVISADASTIAFVSWASTLMPGTKLSCGNVFVWQR